MRIVLSAGFDRFSGYGNDAVDLAVALDKAGVAVTPWPTGLLPGLPRAFTRLLEQDPRGRKDVVVRFAPPFDVRPWEFRQMAPVAVGYSMWERTPLRPEDFDGHGWGEHSPGLEPVDRLWSSQGLARMVVTCPMNRDAFAAMDPDLPIDVVPCGVAPDDWPEQDRDWQGRMQFLVLGTAAPRKNVFAVLETWREMKAALPDFDARLVVHSTGPGLHPGIEQAYGPDLTLSQRPLSREQMVALYRDSHVLVSASRGEGNNKPAMEFMASGGTVVATNWSGHQNWLFPDATYPVAGRLVAAQGAPEAQEFEVDRTDLRAQMLAAFADRREAARRGEQAANLIRASLSWEKVAERFLLALGRTL